MRRLLKFLIGMIIIATIVGIIYHLWRMTIPAIPEETD
jgi:hypothetical protein